MLQKTFFAEDMRKALRLVRDDMGAEAIILANKKVPGGVEVAAAITGDSGVMVQPVKTRTKGAPSGGAPQAEQSASEHAKSTGQVSRDVEAVMRRSSEVSTGSADLLVEAKANRLIKNEQVLKAVAGDTLPVNTTEGGSASVGAVSAYEYYNSGSRVTTQESAAPPVDLASQDSTQEEIESSHPGYVQDDDAAVALQDSGAALSSDEFDAMTERYENELSQVREQLDCLKGMMDQARSVTDPRIIRVRQNAASKLSQLGFSRAASEVITEQMADAESDAIAWKNALTALAQEVSFHQDEFNDRFGCFSFIGSPGVGKTTLITKLAIEHIQQYGREELVLVTLDNQRLGASQQIIHLGKLLQVPVFTGDKAERLMSRIEQAGKNKKILIDTAGVTAIDDYWLEQVHLLKKLPSSSKTVLVVSCTQQLEVLNAMVQDYLLLDIDGVVLTKADEATSIGEALSIVVENKLPVFAVGHSQRTSQPLLKVVSSALVEMFVNKSRRWNVLNDLSKPAKRNPSLEPSLELDELGADSAKD
ncbi:MAG: hypothetical protein KUG76_06575 [Gammaproteobacteria bacterium]|nr:hypothetical protein [Gammaproteobacteria bacterium]